MKASSASALEFALLGLLRHQAQSGYDLRRTFATTPMRHFSDSPGSIYPALRRMKARRWLNASGANGDARKRQEFAITDAGKRALVQWLRQPVIREDVIWRLEQIMLRFAFLDGNVDRSVTHRFLDQFELELAAYVRELREHDKGARASIKKLFVIWFGHFMSTSLDILRRKGDEREREV